MVLLSKLKMATGGFLLLVAVVTAGWMNADRLSARAIDPGDNDTPRIEGKNPAPANSIPTTERPAGLREAEFVFLHTDSERKTVSLVVAGTSAPVLCLRVQEDLRVLVEGRQVRIADLRPGTRIVIRLDSSNRVIQDIRVSERPDKVTVLERASDLDHTAPSEARVLRALPRTPRNVPGILEVFRDNIQIVTELIHKKGEPTRLYPLVGKAELIHCHWKCTVFYIERVEYSYPFPSSTKRPAVEVIYIDEDFLVPTK